MHSLEWPDLTCAENQQPEAVSGSSTAVTSFYSMATAAWQQQHGSRKMAAAAWHEQQHVYLKGVQDLFFGKSLLHSAI